MIPLIIEVIGCYIAARLIARRVFLERSDNERSEFVVNAKNRYVVRP